MSTQERRELADELERIAGFVSQPRSLALWLEACQAMRHAAAALRGEQPVETADSERLEPAIHAAFVKWVRPYLPADDADMIYADFGHGWREAARSHQKGAEQ
jgi:hypothetical protein